MARRNEYLNIGQQAFALRSLLPAAAVTLRHGSHLALTTDLQPTLISRRYSIKIDYRLGVSPEVKVVAPELQLHHEAEVLPHTFPGEKLCLHLPGEWSPNMYIAHTTVPWTSEWLFYYELWLVTGNWEGGGHGEPDRP
ncbi:Uncharacterised protein [Mycobacteroides abscessus]|uniref:hypothetical protein n=1 Tax=Mycobacteroides abscessus TaxID=36809 RepID=UPI0005E57AA8|nr:hypothetical protein [Mycobacteroides abscessus]CPT91680.1 Uncharacterised protein [Mycobacteroides abscessus]CPW10975.1 Uncharacterised protein [Mycobacteroides abscessus]